MKTIIKISPRKYPINTEDFSDRRYKYIPTSAFLSVLKEIDYLSSKIVSITNLPWTKIYYDFKDSAVDSDGVEIVFEYKRKERKLFTRVLTFLMMRDDIARAYCVKFVKQCKR